MAVTTGSDTCRAVATIGAAAVAEVSAVPLRAHSEVLAVVAQGRTEVVDAAVVVAVSAVHVPGVTAAVGGIEVRASEVEVVTDGIAGVNAEVPVSCAPVERTVEVGSGHEGVPLPLVEDVAHVQIAALPVGSVDVVVARHTHQVVEVDLVGSLVLCVRKVQLVGHLVGEEQSLVAGLLVAHCTCRQGCCQHHHQCEYHLLHVLEFLSVRHSVFCSLVQSNSFFRTCAKDFP